jgi:hypothetical protein
MIFDSYSCELCLRQLEETVSHLFLRCSFAKNCWMQIGVIASVWLRPRHIKITLVVPFVMEIIIVMTWCIWKERNVWIFNSEDPSIDHSKLIFKNEFILVNHMAKESLANEMKSWLPNLD